MAAADVEERQGARVRVESIGRLWIVSTFHFSGEMRQEEKERAEERGKRAE